jgi:PPK2 family polyphosphate:nucleotide phosphotransferase
MGKAHRLDHRPFLVPPGTKIQLADYDPAYTAGFKDKAEANAALLQDVSELSQLQDVFWAARQYALIIVFQALDAAGKDSTIKHVMSGINPQGVDVYSFKAPSDDERIHHFLWRPMQVIPSAGKLAIFNRSYYEEVLVVRVHPEFLESQPLVHERRKKDMADFWRSRFDEINAFEKILSTENTRVIKFFLNVSRDEQRARFLARLEDPEKHWKFSVADVRERAFWDDYQKAYQEMLSATSTEIAPWYIIPADKKWFMRACVADIISAHLRDLNLEYPHVSDREAKLLAEAKKQLETEAN